MRRKSSLEVEEMAIATINPATGKIIKTFSPLTDPQIDEKIGKAAETFRSYRRSSFADRGNWMIQAARILEEEQDLFGRLMTLAQALCAGCGAIDVIGAAAAYMQGWGRSSAATDVTRRLSASRISGEATCSICEVYVSFK
ncbi:MAG: aldehyde dehydrogenase family protein [Candidatus Manganitrophus sp.]|nr:aldehyde dehydrogenase family protein [Candidatus Manganitrophus sp.]MDC4226644.1 aldehyde dehydrogenase family protein [Candidatus Manganitrophus sp.]WDT72199.1 MAG: aldehyde dehydrogenase family protein [Candidatus Manganitrophus sp.]WDT80385.1 MAG: aldehyde dehydrogenase family protein [Candidatus Manganitrophus sp.]